MAVGHLKGRPSEPAGKAKVSGDEPSPQSTRRVKVASGSGWTILPATVTIPPRAAAVTVRSAGGPDNLLLQQQEFERASGPPLGNQGSLHRLVVTRPPNSRSLAT